MIAGKAIYEGRLDVAAGSARAGGGDRGHESDPGHPLPRRRRRAGWSRACKFQNLRDAGDPVELAARYDDEGADELVFYDITASAQGGTP